MKIKLLLLLFIAFFSACQNEITVYMIGDSTMANKKEPEKNPERGWGQMFQDFFDENVTIENHAVNGRSTRSFINENRWDSIGQKLKKGDYVFIQFGHNDSKKKDPKRYTNPYTAYRQNLIKFVNDTRSKGAVPILLTSIVRRKFNEFGTLVDTHGAYPEVTRTVAKELNVPLIDLQYLTELLEEEHGDEGSKKLHLHYKANEHEYYPEGKIDDTHLSVYGATEVAKLVVSEIKKQNISLGEYIVH